jgi:hypothetical protein
VGISLLVVAGPVPDVVMACCGDVPTLEFGGIDRPDITGRKYPHPSA